MLTRTFANESFSRGTVRLMRERNLSYEDAQNEQVREHNAGQSPREPTIALAPLRPTIAFATGALQQLPAPPPVADPRNMAVNALCEQAGMDRGEAWIFLCKNFGESIEQLVERAQAEGREGMRYDNPAFNPWTPNPDMYPEESKRQAYMSLVDLLSQLLMARSAEGRTEVIRAVSNQNLIQTLRGLANGVVEDYIVVQRWADRVCTQIQISGGRAYGEAHQIARRFIKELEDAANRFPGPGIVRPDIGDPNRWPHDPRRSITTDGQPLGDGMPIVATAAASALRARRHA